MWQAYEVPLLAPEQDSYGYRRSRNLRPGLNLLIDDYTLQDDLIVETEAGKPGMVLEFSFMLSGRNAIEYILPGNNFLEAYWDHGQGGRFHWQAGTRVLKVDIHIEPDVFETLVAEQIEGLPIALQQVLHDRKRFEFYQTGTITTAMQTVLRQIICCPYQGVTQKLYLESKVLELIALRIEQSIQSNSALKHQDKTVLRSSDIDCIYQAKEILLTNWQNPPSLTDLARQSGLNDYKLKAGFREVFGTTVFGYLHLYRMEQAQRLLSQKQMSIREVGLQLGYSNPRCFADAFKKQFGITPRAFAGR
ncbi:MAG: AraC family transcriptional regulator [Elainellaceae cyanobacterium]